MKYLSWISINLLLPFAPFVLKAFVNYFGSLGYIEIKTLLNQADILIYSFMICVINLNINLNGQKNGFEKIMRFFLFIIIIFDNVILTMIYLNQNVSSHISLYFYIAVGYPIIMGPIYKYNYQRDDF